MNNTKILFYILFLLPIPMIAMHEKAIITYNSPSQEPSESDFYTKAFIAALNKLKPEQQTLIHVQEKQFECTLCSKTYTEKSSLTRHMNQHTKAIIYICPYCNKEDTDKTNHKRHLNKHTKTKLYICNSCPKEFIYKTSYENHLLTHENEKAYQCLMCNQAFNTKPRLNIHINKAHHNGKSTTTTTTPKVLSYAPLETLFDINNNYDDDNNVLFLK